MNAKAGILGILLALIVARADAELLPRVASLSVCADQYLLTLADPAQIAALSAQSRDPSLSFLAAEARAFPQTRGRAEEVLALHPDIVLSDSYANAASLKLIEETGIRSVLLPEASSFADVEASLRQIGRAIGRAEAGEAAAETLERRRAALGATRPAAAPRALYLLPTGATAGTGTYVDEVLRLAGFANDAARRGIAGWQRLPLEILIHDPPPLVIMSFLDRNQSAIGMVAATNPARLRIRALANPIAVPNALWPCAGPMLIEAAAYLRARLPEAQP